MSSSDHIAQSTPNYVSIDADYSLHSAEIQGSPIIVGDEDRLLDFESFSASIDNVARSQQRVENDEPRLDINNHHIRVINKPELGRLDRLQNAHIQYGTPAAGLASAILGVDPTGIGSAVVSVGHETLALAEETRNLSIHNKWVKQLVPAPEKVVISNAELNEKFQEVTQGIIRSSFSEAREKNLSEEQAFELIKKRFANNGMPIDNIRSYEELTTKLQTKSFTNKLFKQFKPRALDILNSKAQVERQHNAYQQRLQGYSDMGLAADVAKERAEADMTHKVMTNNANRTLASTVKKIQSLHKKFLVFNVINSVVQVGVNIAVGAANIAIKVASLVGVISAPVSLVTIPISLVPLAFKVIGGGIRLAIVARYRPESSQQFLQGTNAKLATNKLMAEWHKARYKAATKNMKKLWKEQDSIAQKLETTRSETKRNRLQKKLEKSQSKSGIERAKSIEHRLKVEKRKEKINEYETVLIDAGWKDAKTYLSLIPANDDPDADYAQMLSEWVWDSYRHGTLSHDTQVFFNDKMAIDIENIANYYPGREMEAITHHIKEFFAKDEEQMMNMIKSQRRLQRKRIKKEGLEL